MSRLLKGLLILLAVVIVLVGGLALAAESPWFARFLARQASSALDREVTLDGGLQIDWSLHPWIRFPALTVANPAWASDQPMARVEATELSVDLSALPRGRLAITDLLLVEPRLVLVRAEDGRSSWDGLGGEDGGDGGDGGGLLSVTLDTVRLRDGHIDYADATQALRLDLAVSTIPDEAGGAERLRVAGSGSRRGAPIELDLRGGPLLAVTDAQQPYPVAGWLRSKETVLEGEGSLRRPVSPEAGAFSLSIQGPNPAHLHDLLGLSLPDLPPYELRGELSFGNGEWSFRDFSGTVGDSNLAGSLTITPGEPLAIQADLRSRRLDLDDVAPAFGGAPAAGAGETASAEQRRQADVRGKDEEVLPEATADRSRLQGIEAQVRFRGERVNAPRKIPIEQVAFTLRLKDGVLRFDPLTFGVGGGKVDSKVSFDTNKQPAEGQLDARAENIDLGDLLRDFGIPSGGFGTIRAELDTGFTGESVQQVFDSVDGSLLVYMTSGQVDAVLIALAGLDAGQALVERFFGSGPTPIECAFMHVQATDGVAKMERFLIATEDIDLTAAGTVYLGKERLDIALRGYPRSPTIGASDAPIRLEGRFADAELTILSDELLARGALAALAALVAPPLALVPFLNLGTGDEKEDVCAALTREAKKIEADSGSG